ncbi:KH domain-containing protein [Atopobacter phocae]|uniref:KH domain-containing protein n=1 Tax=Atopobacter phocae TaxID=136492 RepID=UPI00046EDEA9|nr:KH domain-containing protein [Atopobacter phocae]
MPNVEELILTIVKPLIEHPDDVTITIEPSGQFTDYRLTVHPDDIGRVIGKKGRVARAIRTIVYSIRGKDGKKIRLTIIDPNEQ